MAASDQGTGLLGAIVHAIAESVAQPRTIPGEEWIKLVHADRLKRWDRLRRYDAHESTTLAEYREKNRAVRRLRRQVSGLIQAEDRLAELDVDTPVEYRTELVRVPGDLLKRGYRAKLPPAAHDGTRMAAREGEIEQGALVVRRARRGRTIDVRYACPSREAHRDEIAELRQRLDAASPEDRAWLAEVRQSRYLHPLLFISHRWESRTHPDPEGSQLAKLRALEGCYIIYDFCSFPQAPRTEDEGEALGRILRSMNRLVRDVVILDAQTYLERGWCLYEYISASISKQVICDEINAPALVELRNLVATRLPISPRLTGSGMESTLQNSKNEQILDCVNKLLPLFERSGFTEPGDRAIVKDLLIEKLIQALPGKLVYQQYLGEWKQESWTREELENAFTNELKWDRLEAGTRLKPRQPAVPDSIEAAVRARYRVEDPAPFDPATWQMEWIGLVDDEAWKGLGEGLAIVALVLLVAALAGLVLIVGLAALVYFVFFG